MPWKGNTSLAKQHRRAFPHLHSGVFGDVFETIAVIARWQWVASPITSIAITYSIRPTIRLGTEERLVQTGRAADARDVQARAREGLGGLCEWTLCCTVM